MQSHFYEISNGRCQNCTTESRKVVVMSYGKEVMQLLLKVRRVLALQDENRDGWCWQLLCNSKNVLRSTELDPFKWLGWTHSKT